MKLKNFLFIFIVFMIGILGIDNVDAANYTIKSKYCGDYVYNYTNYKKYAFTSTKEVDSQHRFTIQYSSSPTQIVYCTEKGVPIKLGTKNYTKVANVSDTDKEGNIAKAIAYGKNGTNSVSSCNDERIATSFLIHMISKGYKENNTLKWKSINAAGVKATIEKAPNKTTLANKFIEIRDKVLDHDKMPFAGIASPTKATAQSKAVHMKWTASKNFYRTISDSLLSDSWGWKIIEKDSGITSATISGGNLSVNAEMSTKGKTLCVKIRKTVKAGELYAKKETSTQDTALLVNEKDAYKTTWVCFKSSYVAIKKVDAADENKVLSGAGIGLYQDKECKKYAKSANDVTYDYLRQTDKDGYAYFYNMSDGTYYTKEEKSPEKYIPDSNSCREVKVTNGVGTVTFKNNKISSTSVQVFKVDKYTNRGISNVKIGLYSDDTCKTKSTLVEEPVKTTDSTGMVLWDKIATTGLNPNDTLTLYVMEEKSSIPSGYIQEKENDCKKVQISGSDVIEGEIATEVKNSTTIYNIPFGKISILKLDDDTRKPLENVTFKLLDENKKEVIDKNGNKVGPAVTDKNGVATVKDILYGIYYIEEVKTNEDYKTSEPYLFELNVNTDSIKLANLAAIPYYISDVNMDNVVNINDLNELNTMLKDEKNLIGLEKKKHYSTDVNKDGIINNDDAEILKFYLDNKDYVISQINAYETLCKGQEKCELNFEQLKNISKITQLDDTESNQICYAPAAPSPALTGDDGDTPNGALPEAGSEDENQNPSNPTPEEGNDENQSPNGGSGGVYNPSTSTSTCHFTEKSLEYLRQYITANTTKGLNADFNGDSKVEENDAKILELYLSHVKKGTIGAVINYVTSVEKIKEIGTATIPILKRIGIRDVIPSEEVHASIVITNIPIDMKISKFDISSYEELPGAEIVIKNSKGEEVVKFVSTNEVTEFYISEGEYTLTETATPKGYNKIETSLKFKVKSDGNIELVDNNSELFELVKSEEERDNDLDHLLIYNTPIKKTKVKVPNTGSKLAIATILVGTILVASGGYLVYNRYKTGEAK